MKEKSVRKTSINDLLSEHQKSEKAPIAAQVEKATSALNVDYLTEDDLQNIKNYNKNITNLDPLYSSVTPTTDVLIRVFLTEPKITESGFILPHKEIVPIKTANGIANWAEVHSDFPYSTKAVVVAVPNGSNLEAGMIVQISPNQVKAEVVGASNNAFITIKSAFVHADGGEVLPPKDITNRNYGYLLIPFYEIKAIL